MGRLHRRRVLCEGVRVASGLRQRDRRSLGTGPTKNKNKRHCEASQREEKCRFSVTSHRWSV